MRQTLSVFFTEMPQTESWQRDQARRNPWRVFFAIALYEASQAEYVQDDQRSFSVQKVDLWITLLEHAPYRL